MARGTSNFPPTRGDHTIDTEAVERPVERLWPKKVECSK